MARRRKSKRGFKGSRKMKRDLSKAQNHRCCYCSEPFSDDPESPKRATWEHIIPISCGGANDLSNIVLACYECNHARGARHSAEDFSNLIKMGRLSLLMSEMHYLWNKIKVNEKLAA